VSKCDAQRSERRTLTAGELLDRGECVFDNLPTDYVNVFNALAEASSDNTMLIPWEIWRDNFIQDAPESVARSFWERPSPEP
jgi:hypothetical protein